MERRRDKHPGIRASTWMPSCLQRGGCSGEARIGLGLKAGNQNEEE